MTDITQILIPIGTLILGALIGHRLQLWGERRKEYNELADQLFLKFNRTIHASSNFGIPQDQVDLIYRRMGRIHRWRLQRAIKQYHQVTTATTRNAHNIPIFDNPEAMTKALRKIANILRRK